MQKHFFRLADEQETYGQGPYLISDLTDRQDHGMLVAGDFVRDGFSPGDATLKINSDDTESEIDQQIGELIRYFHGVHGKFLAFW
mmetsp:Transcript_28890/g.61003  ORF Transcript_28890/g.61003 Transcript_28890/m.61003 type:complete len:85 (+) Transcript_28890:652-906(+)